MSLLDIDAASAALISQLTLDDIDNIRDSSKGKARVGSPHALRFFRDLEFAQSIDNALELDQPVLSVLVTVEDGVRDDHLYAEALHNGRTLPTQSEVQRLMEDPDFSLLSQHVDEVANDVDDAEENERTDDAHEMRPMRAQCVICRDDLRAFASFRAPCDHFYCRQCLSDLANACIGDESLFPLQCCRQNLRIDGVNGVLAQLDVRLRLALQKKAVEFGTVFINRLYCPRPTCSLFLGSTIDHTDDSDVACPRCRTEVCATCKQIAHPGERCGENAAVEMVKALAREQHWQTCPGCAQIIDLQQGCYHMTCRCRTEFCYLCAARWKTCSCPQWEEARLLNTAEQRVENEMGARARAAAPAIFQQRVEQRMERLRYEHDCANGHRWSRRNGRARCEECRFMLPEYLLIM
ncbi:hypothetical protein B0H13DRAFT_2336337 [Mycena leptocephala]|nr:hypothetical protein B0H13DRAFT_2336337 [Mycena leptocephala]